MDKITITLTNDECKVLYGIIKKIEDVMNPKEDKPKKWIDKGEYMLNTVTGARIDKVTKRRYWNVHGKEDDGLR